MGHVLAGLVSGGGLSGRRAPHKDGEERYAAGCRERKMNRESMDRLTSLPLRWPL
jgi:hypothetical protein